MERREIFYGTALILILLVVAGTGCISTSGGTQSSSRILSSSTSSSQIQTSTSSHIEHVGLSEWYKAVSTGVVYASDGYQKIARYYFPGSKIEPASEYKGGIIVASPSDALKFIHEEYATLVKEPYFGYTLYADGYHFVGADKGLLVLYRSNSGYDLIITGTGKAGVGAAARFAQMLRQGEVNLSPYAVIDYGSFQAVPLKEIGDNNWDGIEEDGELVRIYQLYYTEPFQYYWRMINGSNVTVSGAFIRSVNGSTVYIRALGFNISVKLKGAGRNLTYVVENVNPKIMRLENEGSNARIISKGETFVEVSSNGSFSLVAKNISSYTVLAFGDHRPRYGSQPPKVFLDIMHRINNESGVFVIDGGDLVLSGKVYQWAALMNVWKWDKPIFVAPGNHEYQGEGINLFHYFFGPVDYAFSLGGYRYIIMNDVQHGYSLTSAQFSWLENQLRIAKHRGERPVVIMHAPPYNPIPGGEDHAMNEASAQRLLSLMRQYNAFGIFSHIHMNWKGEYEGVHFIIAGGGGAPLYAPPDEGGYHGYAILNMGANGNISVRFVRVS